MRGGTALGIGRKLANPSSFSISRQFLVPFSTSSSDGGGRGRGRGRGGPTPPSPSLFNFLAEQYPDQPDSDPTASLSGAGHGRGKPLSQPPPSSFASGIKPGSSAGRGHVESRAEPPPSFAGLGIKPAAESRATHGADNDDGFRRENAQENLPASVMTAMGGTGRGKPIKGAEAQTGEENRHIGAPVEPKREPRKPKLTREEAVRQAMSILQQGDGDGALEADVGGGGRWRGGESGMMRGRGRGGEFGMTRGRGRGGGRGRGRGRGGRGRRDGEGDRRREGDRDGGIASGLYLGDNADGEKLAKRLGPQVMNQLTEAFEEIGAQVLPSPLDDAYVDALDTNCKV